MRKQKGFGVIEVILIVVVVMIVVGFGWYAMNGQKAGNNNPPLTAPASTSDASSVTVHPSHAAIPTPPEDCPKMTQDGVAIFIEITATGAEPACMQVSKDTAIGINNKTDQGITAIIGNKTRIIPPGSGAGFDDAVGQFASVGKNVLNISTLDSSKDPVIWVY